jgi:hypothetical protein
VLAPYGVAMVGDKKVTKPYPKEMDEWPQYLHGADNNAVAKGACGVVMAALPATPFVPGPHSPTFSHGS